MDNDRLKLWLDFLKVFVGTFVLGFLGWVVDSGIKDREVGLKESEQVGKYVEIALGDDLNRRIKFAEYFKTVTSQKLSRERWENYHDLLIAERATKLRRTRVLQKEQELIMETIDSVDTYIEAYIDTNANPTVGLHNSEHIKDVLTDKILQLDVKKQKLEDDVQHTVANSYSNEQAIIGLYHVKGSDHNHYEIKAFIEKMDYVLDSEYHYEERPDWMARECTVFYYRKGSRQQAVKIASEMKTITKKDFKVRMGSGLGVGKGNEKNTFFIHNIH